MSAADVVALRPADLLVTHGNTGPRLWVVDAEGNPRATTDEPLPPMRSAVAQASVERGTLREVFDATKGTRTAEQVAAAAGMSRSALYFVLDATNTPKPATVEGIAGALGVSVRDAWLAAGRTLGLEVDL